MPVSPGGVAIGPAYCPPRVKPDLYADAFAKFIGALILFLVVMIVCYIEGPWRDI
jgi:hypothetical protein